MSDLFSDLRFLKSLEEELNNESSQVWTHKAHLLSSVPIYEAEIYSKCWGWTADIQRFKPSWPKNCLLSCE